MTSSYLIGEHLQQGIISGPGRPLQEVAAELHARYQHLTEQGAPTDAL